MSALKELGEYAYRDAIDGHDVVLFCDGPGEWYARGIDVDYIAQGDSREAAKVAFSRGWKATGEAQKEAAKAAEPQ